MLGKDILVYDHQIGVETKQNTSIKVSNDVTYTKLVAVNEMLLYGVAEKKVYLLDFSKKDFQPLELQIKVKGNHLFLEDDNKLNRVQGEAEYKMLSDICMKY